MTQGPRVNSFGRALRLIRTREFDRVFQARKSLVGRAFILYGAPNDLAYSRLGLSIGRRAGGSVERNRLKRLMREAFRTSKGALPEGFDFVVVAKKGAEEADFGELKAEIVTLAGRIGERWKK